jgi:hypothetical protein
VLRPVVIEDAEEITNAIKEMVDKGKFLQRKGYVQ